jgi:hypothetical protein
MLNSKPNNSKYHQGNFIPQNKEKVLKLNTQGGIYYRSGLELKVMTFLDSSDRISKWGAECIAIPYQLTHYESNGDINLKNHTYYPDFYYELSSSNGDIRKVVAEVKPMKEFNMVKMIQEKKINIPEGSNLKKLKNLEYDVKMAQKNMKKWETMIKFCDKKGWEFIVITEEVLKKFGL